MAITVHLIAAARPNFMKVAPLLHAMRKSPDLEPKLVHTGQHYDANMSDAILSDLGVTEPDFHLGVGSGSHAQQTGMPAPVNESLWRQVKAIQATSQRNAKIDREKLLKKLLGAMT